MAIDTKLRELEPSMWQSIRGESCFEKNTFEDTENPHSPTKTRLPVKEYLRKYSRYRKKLFCFEALLNGLFYSMENSVLII